MTMLTGTRAFEACWQSLKSSVAGTAADSHLLMQSMGRLVDNYASQDEILQELPVVLRDAFDQLVDAYLNGYWLESAEDAKSPKASASAQRSHTGISPAMLEAAQLRQRRKMEPTASSEAATYIVHDPAELSVRTFGCAFS